METKEFLGGKLRIEYGADINMSKGFTRLYFNVDYSYGLYKSTFELKRPCESDDSGKSIMIKALNEAIKWCNNNLPVNLP